MEAGARAERGLGAGLPSWALGLIPLALIAALIGGFALLGGPGLGERTGPPVEEVAIEQTVLRPGEIELTLRNDGPDPVEVAQVAVNDAYAPFVADGGREIGRLSSTTLRVEYPVDRRRGLRDLRPHLRRRHRRSLDPGRRGNAGERRLLLRPDGAAGDLRRGDPGQPRDAVAAVPAPARAELDGWR